MNQIAPHRASQIMAPSSTTRAMDRMIGVYSNRLEEMPGNPRKRLVSASLAPAGADRQILIDRRLELSDSLRASLKADREDVILGIIAGFATYRMTDRELDLKVALYDEALRSEPAWIIDRARQIFGKDGWQCNWNGNDCPPSASVAAECRFIALPYEAELYRISLILDAELVDNDTTQDERDQAIADWMELRKQIASSNVISERTDEEIQRERDAMQRANQICRAKGLRAQSELREAEMKASVTRSNQTQESAA